MKRTAAPTASKVQSVPDENVLRHRMHSFILEQLGRNERLPDILYDLAVMVEAQIPRCRCAIMLVHDGLYRLNRAASPKLSSKFMEKIDCSPIQAGSIPAAWAAFHKRFMQIEDLSQPGVCSHDFFDAARLEGIQACASQPILNSARDAMGTVDVYFDAPNSLSNTQREILEEAARLAQTAIDQRLADMEIAHTREQLRVILENVEAIPFKYDFAEGRFLYLSDRCEQLFGRAMEDFQANPYILLGFPSVPSPSDLVELKRRIASLNEKKTWEYEIVDANGLKRRMEGRFAVQWAANGNVRRISGIIHDISEKHALEKELEVSRQLAAVGLLAAGVAHEIGNPLAFISARLQRVRKLRDPSLLLESVPLIETQVKRITETLRKISAYARSSSGGWVDCDVAKIIQDVIDLLLLDPRSQKVSIDFQIEGQLPRLRLIADQIKQVFLNVALNALDAMPEGGELRIRSYVSSDDLFISFHDTGEGIPDQHSGNIFKPFFSTREEHSNMGLGLFICLSFVNTHGGSMNYSSTPKEGTVFRIRLPLSRIAE